MIVDNLTIKMLVSHLTVKNLLAKISALEVDTEMTLEEKLSQIKKIKEELTKVGTEIDSIKKEITLLNTCNVN